MITIRLSKADADALRQLDLLLSVQRTAETHNLPVTRGGMSIGHFRTSIGELPFLIFESPDAVMRPRIEVELNAFARFAGEVEPSEQQQALIAAYHEIEPAMPVVTTPRAQVSSVLEGHTAVLTVGTQGAPGWSTSLEIRPDAHEYLQRLIGTIGGVIICFADRDLVPPAFLVSNCAFTTATDRGVGRRVGMAVPEFDWPTRPSVRAGSEPTKSTKLRFAKTDPLDDLRRTPGLADAAKALAKGKPRDLLILLLAVDQQMDPAAIGRINLTQIRIHDGRVYLKGKLIRRKVVYSLLESYRKRDRDLALDGDPLFRDPKEPGKRLGATRIRGIIDDYATRAKRRLDKQASTTP